MKDCFNKNGRAGSAPAEKEKGKGKRKWTWERIEREIPYLQTPPCIEANFREKKTYYKYRVVWIKDVVTTHWPAESVPLSETSVSKLQSCNSCCHLLKENLV